MPSKPRMTSFCVNFESAAARGARAGQSEHAATTASASARTFGDFGMEMLRIISAVPAGCNLRAMEAVAPGFPPGSATPSPGARIHALRGGLARARHRRLDGGVFRCADAVLDADGRAAVRRSSSPSPSGRVTGMSGLDFQDLRAQQSSFTALAASTRIRTALASTEGAEVVLGEAVSGEYFGVMQLGALRGRLLNPLDERESSRVRGPFGSVSGGSTCTPIPRPSDAPSASAGCPTRLSASSAARSMGSSGSEQGRVDSRDRASLERTGDVRRMG